MKKTTVISSFIFLIILCLETIGYTVMLFSPPGFYLHNTHNLKYHRHVCPTKIKLCRPSSFSSRGFKINRNYVT